MLVELYRSMVMTRTTLLWWVCGLPALLACSSGVQEIARERDGDAQVADPFDASSPEPDAGQGDAEEGDASEIPPPSCLKASYTATLTPLDMLIVLDQSGSMNDEQDRWTPVTNAIKTFVSSPELASTGVALEYFPLANPGQDKCDASTYAAPDVPMRDLAANAAPIRTSIDAHYFPPEDCCDTPEHDGTPTRPAMEGATQYMRAWLSQHSDHVGVILLATDGEPSDVCDDNTADDVTSVVAAAAMASPVVRSYVIGIGYEKNLAKMAAAGGTGSGPFLVDGSGIATETQLLQALATIRSEALPCDYAMPDDPDVSPSTLNVQETRTPGSEPITFINVASKDACDDVARSAWYYDDPASPTRLTLCPDTCIEVADHVGTTVELVVGCETVVL